MQFKPRQSNDLSVMKSVDSNSLVQQSITACDMLHRTLQKSTNYSLYFIQYIDTGRPTQCKDELIASRYTPHSLA